MGTRDPRIDAYIAKAAPFAQPILEHRREVVIAPKPLEIPEAKRAETQAKRAAAAIEHVSAGTALNWKYEA